MYKKCTENVQKMSGKCIEDARSVCFQIKKVSVAPFDVLLIGKAPFNVDSTLLDQMSSLECELRISTVALYLVIYRPTRWFILVLMLKNASHFDLLARPVK